MNLFKIALSFSGFSIPLVTELLILIDAGIYAIVTATIKGFYDILQVSYTIFGESNGEGLQLVSALVQRVMMLSGIYALFKVSLMLINYIIDPSKLKSAEKTGFDIAKNIFIAIVLLATSRFIFQKLGEFQKLVFESNVIENIIYGNNGEDAKKEIIGENNAERLSNNMWLMFFTAKKGAPANSECSAKYANVSSGEAGILSLIGCHYKYYDYLPVAPFIVGVLLIYYFLIYCIELASRMLKLLILEMISPIPIIMSIDPNQKNKLSNFIKTYIPIYLQIFLRVLTFYGAFAVGSLVIGSAETIAKGSTNVDWFLKVLIVIGVFQGMKELPKLIEDALGFKISGGNSEKTFGGYVRGIMGGTTGLALGGIAGGVTGGVGGAVVGAISGGVSSLAGAAGAKNSGEAISRTIANIGKSGRVGGLVRDVGGLFPYTGALIGNATGGQKKDANKLKGYESSIEKENTAINNITKAAELRSRLNSTMTSEYERINGSLSDRLANDDRLNELRLSMNDSSVPQTAQVKFDNQKLLEEAEQAVRNEYNEDKSRWMSNQLELASNTSDISTLAPETQAIKRDLENVNTFANDVGLSSKIVTATTNFESLSQQDVVDIYKHEQQRRNIEEERKEFKESEGFKNREQLQKFNSEQKKRHGGR